MSLSKYYKSSEGFQPEELFKPIGEQQFKRSNYLQKKTEGFRPNPFTAYSDEAAAHDPPPAQDPSSLQESATTSAETGATDGHQQAGAEDTTDAKQPEIDLSNYINLEEARGKIDQAYQRGLEEGRQKAEEDFGDATKALLGVCQQLDSVRETIINNSRQELQEFALAIAERILRISLADQDKTIVLTVEEALQRAVKSDEFTVYVHPDDFAIVSAKSPDLISGLSGLNNIVVKKDSSVGRGGAKIESENCTIDATVASQFEMIKEEVARRL